MLQVGEYGGEVSSAEDGEGASDDDDLSGALRDAELAAFADLDLEARRLVLESIAGSMSDDEDDEASAQLAAALVAEAERLEQLDSARASKDEAVHVEDWQHGAERPLLDDADSNSNSSQDSISNSSGDHGSGGSSNREAADASEPLQQPVSSSIDVTSPAGQLSSRTNAAGDVDATSGPLVAASINIAEPDDCVEEEEAVDWEQREPEAVAACVAASGDWSRIVRRAGCTSMRTTLTAITLR